ncbi:MAG: hypothetical protein H0V66_12750, partial [Bdellovibrionales bacterium]|nr:hypothetical protein [Bdellovibrionales bacterium]
EKFIRENNFKWWFHVAPLVNYKQGQQTKKAILDAALSTRPLSLQKWTNKLMQNKAVCQPIERYSQYALSAASEDCQVYLAPMYYWQPKDLENLEYDGVEKVNFFEWEINRSLEQAFGIIGTH